MPILDFLLPKNGKKQKVILLRLWALAIISLFLFSAQGYCRNLNSSEKNHQLRHTRSSRIIPANWDASDKTSYYHAANVAGVYKKTAIASVRGRYKDDAIDLEMKFDSAFNSYFRKYAAEVFPSKSKGENIEVLARAIYGKYEVEALLIIQPDRMYVLKVCSAAKEHNDKWARSLKAKIDK
jgi:hypothetical protein